LNTEYYNINNYEESLAKKVNIIVHACMPQWLTNIKAQQRIDDYGRFNDIMNLTLTINRQSKIMSIELRVNIPVRGDKTVFNGAWMKKDAVFSLIDEERYIVEPTRAATTTTRVRNFTYLVDWTLPFNSGDCIKLESS
jgi:hypothetical protein